MCCLLWQKGSITMTTINNTNTANTIENIISEKKFYLRSDNNHQCVSVKLSVMFLKEGKDVKVENSVGFKRVATDIKGKAKDLGVKAYFSTNVFKTDDNGEYMRDKFGDRIKESAWLFETGDNFDLPAIENALTVFENMVKSGLESGKYKLEPPKEKKEKGKTKAELQEENEALKKRIAELEAQIH